MPFRSSILAALLALSAPLAAQTDTLRHVAPGAPLALPAAGATSATWGHVTGHNYRYTEEFAEKYHLTGPARLVGVVGHFGGTRATPARQYSVRAYRVGANRLPGTALATRAVAASALDFTGGPTAVTFATPVAVADSFFVSFNLGDYAHGGDANQIGVLAGPRDPADGAAFGRNAVRQHSHGAVVWRDMATQNVPVLSAHLALFPVVEFTATAGEPGAVSTGGLRVLAPAPNPATAATALRIKTARDGALRVTLYDALGRRVLALDEGVRPAGAHTVRLDVSGLPAGVYVATVEAEAERLAVRVTVAR